MRVKATRESLDWKGRRSKKTVSTEVDDGNFDPAAVVRQVVCEGSMTTKLDQLPEPSFDRHVIDDLLRTLSGGCCFCDAPRRGAVDVIAGEFIPLGFQYVLFDRSGRTQSHSWAKTDVDLAPETEGRE